MNKHLMLLAAALVMLVSCSKLETTVEPTMATESGVVAKKKKPVPFQGQLTYAFTAEYDLPCDCGDFYPVGTFYGTGNLSHFGNVTSHIKPCVSPIIEGGNYIGDHVGVECAYFTAANGDTVYCYTYPYDILFTPAGAVGVATVDFVGGTGRFKNATGSFTGTVTVMGATATFSNISGSIQY